MASLLRRWVFLAISGLAGLAWNQSLGTEGFAFTPATGLSNRFITPNGDKKNDDVIFTVTNPRDSEITGSIYDLHGKFVSAMTVIGTTQLKWDAKSNGTVVPAGVYFYVLSAEEQSFSGTVVVIR